MAITLVWTWLVGNIVPTPPTYFSCLPQEIVFGMPLLVGRKKEHSSKTVTGYGQCSDISWEPYAVWVIKCFEWSRCPFCKKGTNCLFHGSVQVQENDYIWYYLVINLSVGIQLYIYILNTCAARTLSDQELLLSVLWDGPHITFPNREQQERPNRRSCKLHWRKKLQYESILLYESIKS